MEHLFTEKERQFFATQRQQIQQLQAAYNNALQLVLVQNDLAGQWRPKDDGSGFEKVEAASGPVSTAAE